MTAYAETLREHRRLALLRHMSECPEYTSNASILVDVCHGLGIRSTREDVVRDLVWLAGKGLATVQDHGDFMVATASGRGVEVSRGLLVVEGVQRPRPRD